MGRIPSLDWPRLFRLDKIMMVFLQILGNDVETAEKEVTTFWRVFVCVIVCMNDNKGIYYDKHFF